MISYRETFIDVRFMMVSVAHHACYCFYTGLDRPLWLQAVSIQGWTGPYGSRRLKLPEFLDIWQKKIVRLSAVKTCRFFAHERSLVVIEADSTRGP
jgi:hypothetical protein